MKLRLFLFCLIVVALSSCISKKAKVVSTDIVAGQEFHRKQDVLVYQKLQRFIEYGLQQMLEAKKQELEAVKQRLRAQAQEEINQAFFSSLDEQFGQIEKETREKIEAETDADRKFKWAAISYKRKADLYTKANELRASLMTRVLAEVEAEAKSSEQKLEQIRVDSQSLATQINEPLTAIQQHEDQLFESQKQLDAYIQKKSEITLVLSGFLHGLGININDGRIDGVVNTFSEKLEGKANGLIEGLNTRLSARLSNAATSLKTATVNSPGDAQK